MISLNSEFILISLLILFFLTEAITKITIFSNMEKFEIQAGLKALVFGLVLIGLVIYRKKELFYIVILFCLFSIGQLHIPNSFNWPVLQYFFKYIFAISLVAIFSNQSQSPKLKLLNIYEFVLIFNSVLILFGYLFDITYFRTYMGTRFGYNGLMASSATGTYFYVIGMCYFLARYKERLITNWKFWLVVLCATFIGTKSIALALVFISVFYIIKYIPSKRFKLILLFLFISIFIVFTYYLFFINPMFQSLTRSSGLLTSFLSMRDKLWMDYTLPYIQEYWGIWNYLFGGLSNFELRAQMELLDTLFFWGIIGGIAFSYFYFKSFFQDKIQGSTTIFILVLILLIAFFAGNFFYNASLPIYLIILRESMRLNPKNSF